MSDERKHHVLKTAIVHGMILTVGILIGKNLAKKQN